MNRLINLLNRVLNSNGTKLKKIDEYMYWSPFVTHHKQKLQINIKTQKWHCWVSNVGGRNLFQLFKKVGATKQNYDELIELVGAPKYHKKQSQQIKEIVSLPEEFKTLCYSDNDSIVKKHALNYLYKRNISDEDIMKYNIGYCDSGLYSNRIIIPSYDSAGQLNFFVGRDFYSNKMKYRNSPTSKNIIGFDLFINWSEPIILCEGVFDAMAFKRNSIPLFGKTLSNSLQKKIIESKVKTIYLALDNDAIKDAINITEKLIKEGIDVKMIKLTDKDPSDLGYKKLIKKINDVTSTTFPELMKMKLKGF